MLLKDLPKHPHAPAAVKPTRLLPDGSVTNYIATYERTQPPPSQIVTTERQNILLRQFQARAESKRERHKRAASDAIDEPKAKRREGNSR